MEQKRYTNKTDKFFTYWNLMLFVIGLMINIVLSKMVATYHCPLFLDTVGTVLVGALGGIVPGMTVGFLTNVLKSFSDSISLYYGIISVAIGALATIFSEKGYFKSIRGWLIISLAFVAITGTAGVSITWFVYGESMGGTSTSIGTMIAEHGVTPYLAQLLADFMVEIPDKLLTVGVICLSLKYCPKNIIQKLPLGFLYLYQDTEQGEGKRVKKSISRRMTYIIMTSIFISCVFSITVSLVYYMQRVKKSCEDFALVVSKQAAGYVDGDQIRRFLTEGEADEEYIKTEENLKILYENSSEVKYLFVYALYEDGVHVVFDLDTPELEGAEPGTVLEAEQGVSSDYAEYTHGEEIPIEYSEGEYGSILTVYTRIYDSMGKVAAYAGVDIDMSSYYKEYAIFAIQVISMIFAMTMLIFIFVLWYINKYITKPIQIIVNQTEQLKNISPELWLDSEEWKNQIIFNTEDELAQLNETVNQIEEKASLSMKRVIETELELLETKKLEEVNEKLEVAVRKAEEANQAKTNFLSRMSHDMRTPLNGILNFSRFIAETDSLEEARKYGSKILASGHYLQTLINDTLGMSRIESGKIILKPEPYLYEDFEASIKNVLEEKASEKGVELKFINTEKSGRALLVDPLRLQQVCINILNNAIKFTPKGGVVIFRTEHIKKSGTKETIQFTITDTGIGMSRKFREEELYKPFAQERLGKDNEETGTGLGLSIAKQLVEIMGGTMTCQSEEGEGTTFTILLTAPIAEKIPQEAKKKADLNRLNGAHILMCEDHYLNRQIAVKLLERKGCIVDTAENGEEGVKKFLGHSEQYDLILMDIRMPVMSGIEAAKVIRSLNVLKAESIPIIALTANAYEDDKTECLRAGMNAHIAKPIEPVDMYEIIAEYL